MKRIASTFLFPLIFLAAGIIVIILGSKNLKKQKNWPTVEAEIISIATIEENTGTETSVSHEATVKYTVDGREYTSIPDTYKSSFAEGKIIEVHYNPDVPGECIVAGKTYLVMFIFGVVAILVAPVLFIKGLKSGG